MSRSIYVSDLGELDESIRDAIEENFKKIHDQKFKTVANFNTDNNWKGEEVTCQHSLSFVSKGTADEFIAIPCHWNYEHAIQTAKDITGVLLRLSIDRFKIIHSY